MKLLSNIPNKVYESLKEEVVSLLLNEATEVSLHQMYDKIYGADRVNKLLALDTSSKKKFAEWVLKILSKKSEGNVGAPAWFDISWNVHIVPLANGYIKNNFQPFSYDGLEYAHRAYDKILKSQAYDGINPVYDDGTIMIYTPQGTTELRELLEVKFNKDPENFSWCVSWVDGQDYWDKYSQDDEYTIFLIYNKSQNKLYLWNNNPNENPYHTGRLCYEFNNWGNTPCSPTDDAELTKGAIEFLNENSSNECTFYDVIDYINSDAENDEAQYNVRASGVLGGRFDIVEYEHDDDNETWNYTSLISCENDEVMSYPFCSSNFSILSNDRNLILISEYGENGGYTVAYFASNGALIVEKINNEEWGSSFSGTLAIGTERDLLIYDTDTDSLVKANICYINPASILFEGTEDNKYIRCMDEDNEFFLIRAKDGEIIFNSMYVVDCKRDNQRNCIMLEMESDYDYEEDLSYFDEVIPKDNIDEPIIEFHFDGEQCYCYIPPQEEDLDETKYNRLGNIIKENLHKSLLSESQESKSIDAAKKLLMQRLGYSKEQADEFIRIKLRNDLPVLRDKNAAKFILGVTRMFLDRQIQDAQTISNLNTTLKYVASEAHINEYDRNLNDMSAQDLIQRFAKNVEMDMENDRNEVNAMEFNTPSDYEIVRIESFEQASEYGKYTSWCVTHHRSMFDSYTSDGMNQFYFCLKNGFENVEKKATKGCPLDEYGLSMIAVCVNEKGSLNTCTCRWNHANGGNDNIMDTKQISQVIGINFYKIFKPNNKWKEMVDNVMQRLKNGEKPKDIFDYFYGFKNGFGKVELKRKYNFIDAEGNLISPNQWFDDCGNFNDGFATVELKRKCNFIDTEGNLISPNQWFDDCGNFHDGVARVILNEKYNFIDTEGNLISPNQWFDNCYNFYNGFGTVILNEKYNFIDTEGNLISPNQWFDNCGAFNYGFTVVILNGKSNWIDTEGNLYDYDTREPLGINVKTMNTQNESLSKPYKKIISETVREKLLEYAGNYTPLNDIAEDVVDEIQHILFKMVVARKHNVYLANPINAVLFHQVHMMNTQRFSGIPNYVLNNMRYTIDMEIENLGQPLYIHADCFDTTNHQDYENINFEIVRNISQNPAFCARTRSGKNVINLLFDFEFHGEEDGGVYIDGNSIISSLGHEMLHAVQNDRKWLSINQNLEIAHEALKHADNNLARSIGYLAYLALPYETSANIHEIGLEIKNMAQDIMREDDLLYDDEFCESYIIEDFKETRIYNSIKDAYAFVMKFTKMMPIENILINTAAKYIDDKNFNLKSFIQSFTTLVPKMIRRADRCWYQHSMKWVGVIRQWWQENRYQYEEE